MGSDPELREPCEDITEEEEEEGDVKRHEGEVVVVMLLLRKQEETADRSQGILNLMFLNSRNIKGFS